MTDIPFRTSLGTNSPPEAGNRTAKKIDPGDIKKFHSTIIRKRGIREIKIGNYSAWYN